MPMPHAIAKPPIIRPHRLRRRRGGAFGFVSTPGPLTARGLALGLVVGLVLLVPSALQAQQPVRPMVRNGSCPMGYYGSGEYCVPSSSSGTRGAIEKSGNGCPMGFYSSGNYCLSTPSNEREAIQKVGPGCPMGWFGSGNYCVKSR